jgi:adenylate cyclase
VDSQSQTAAWLEAVGGLRTSIQGTCFLGRSSTNNIVLNDDRVSRRHTMVHAQGPEEFWLIDLGSSNGTYLNGRRVTQPCRLAEQDRLELGGQCFIFRQPKGTGSTDSGPRTTEKTIQDIKAANCWLLVADMEASTQFIQAATPEEGLRVTGTWLSRCKQLVEERGGTINKFLGDGFLAYWREQESTAPAVVQAVQQLKKLQGEAQPRFRVVLHYGKVLMGGSASLGEESLLGHDVNFVFRMEKLAGSIGAACLLSEPARDQLRSLLPTTEETRRGLPGFEGEFLFFAF